MTCGKSFEIHAHAFESLPYNIYIHIYVHILSICIYIIYPSKAYTRSKNFHRSREKLFTEDGMDVTS